MVSSHNVLSSEAELATHAAVHINTGSRRAIALVLGAYFAFFATFALASLPWTSVLLQRGGWRKGWWLSGQSTVLDAWRRDHKGGKRRSSLGELREGSGGGGGTQLSLSHREGGAHPQEQHERPWSPPPLDDSKPLRRIPIPPGIPVHSRTIPWLNLSVLQVSPLSALADTARVKQSGSPVSPRLTACMLCVLSTRSSPFCRS